MPTLDSLDGIPCSRGRVVVLHVETGTIRAVVDRCMKWTCESCWTIKLAKKTEHLFGYEGDTVMTEYGEPNLSRRAARLKAGYMRVYLNQVRAPLLLADHKLLPEYSPDDTLKQIVKIRDAGMANGIKKVCFNDRWRYEPEPEHVFLSSAPGMSLYDTEQAITDAGFGDMNVGTASLDEARRKIDAFIHGVDTNW